MKSTAALIYCSFFIYLFSFMYSFINVPLPSLLQRVSTRVVVVMVVVRERFSFVMSAICVRIRGLLLRSYHSGFVGTISTLFRYVIIKLTL